MRSQSRLQEALIFSLAILLSSGCSSDDGMSNDYTPPEGVLLSGDPSSPALDALEDIFPDEETSGIEIVFGLGDNTTVGQVNQALAACEGGIIGTLVRLPSIGVVVPADDLDARVAAADAVEGIYASKLAPRGPNALPPGKSVDDQTIFDIDHHLSTRVVAMWNAAGALGTATPIAVWDWFGKGPMDTSSFKVSQKSSDFGMQGYYNEDHDGKRYSHGYEVVSLFAGAQSSATPGVIPGQTPIRATDMQRFRLDPKIDPNVPKTAQDPKLEATYEWWKSEEDFLLKVRDMIKTGNVVLNLSLGNLCSKDVNDEYCDEEPAKRAGGLWAKNIRSLGSEGVDGEDRILIVASAGNIYPPTTVNGTVVFELGWAPWSSEYNAAALQPGLIDADDNPVENLKNTLVVENAVAQTGSPYGVSCLAKGSYNGGNIGAIGTSVAMIGDTTGMVKQSDFGTSFAAPAVAGVASAMWSLDPSLKASEIVERIKKTSRSYTSSSMEGCRDETPANLMDAYAALLSMDSSVTGARVRGAILDVAGSNANISIPNGIFDDKDLEAFRNKFAEYEDQRATDGDFADFSRYDLNGDGFTGGGTAGSFDLDADRDSTEVLMVDLDGNQVRFAEAGLSDIEILCYYAWSDLYKGGPLSRSSLLLGPCGSGGGTPSGRAVPTDRLSTVTAFDSTVPPPGDSQFTDPDNPDYGPWTGAAGHGSASATQSSQVFLNASNEVRGAEFSGTASGEQGKSSGSSTFDFNFDVVDASVTVAIKASGTTSIQGHVTAYLSGPDGALVDEDISEVEGNLSLDQTLSLTPGSYYLSVTVDGVSSQISSMTFEVR